MSPNAASTQARALQTSGVLHSVRSGNAIASFARREPKLQKILQQIQVLTTQILRERAAKRADFRHRMHLQCSRERCLRFKVFRNDAGWIGGVLRITDAENLRRVRELWREKFSRSRRSRRCTRTFCVAKRCADSSENTAPPPARIWQTSSVLCSARSRNSRKFCSWIFELSVPCEAMCAHFLPLEVYWHFFKQKTKTTLHVFQKYP